MVDDTDKEAPRPTPRRRSVGLVGIALILAVVALGLAAWNTWHLHRALEVAATKHSQDAAVLAGLQQQLAASGQESQAGNRRLAGLESGVDDLRGAQRALERRTANLETAFSNLSGQQQSGRDTLLLNDAELLLRAGQQRYELFHDDRGALKAYSQAIEVLAQVQNPAYAPVRVGATTERDALAAAAPPSRQAALDTLSQLRGTIAAMPLASREPEAASKPSVGFWSRIAHAFSGIVTVSRDGSTPPPDAHLARAALTLDLAQAQEALLAFDDATWRTALQRADQTLSAQFDNADPTVAKVHSDIAAMLAQQPAGPAPQLGGALAQLQSLRASIPAPAAAPATATSSGGGQP